MPYKCGAMRLGIINIVLVPKFGLEKVGSIVMISFGCKEIIQFTE